MMSKMKKITLVLVLMMVMTLGFPSEAFALEDGAYIAGRSTSYVNPITGQTEDGGTNIGLGEGMVANVVDPQVLIEKVNGTYYVTIGLGLASSVSNVRFQVLNGDGSLTSIGSTVTGSHSANGDTVNHYRVQVSSPDVYISPRFYVAPMGRDVQFFVLPNSSSATPGTGYYNSLMATVNSGGSGSSAGNSQTSTSANEDADSKDKDKDKEEDIERTKVGSLSKEELFADISGLSSYVMGKDGKVDPNKKLTAENLKNEAAGTEQGKKSNSNLMIILISVAVVALIIGGGGFYYVKKIKK